MKNLKIKKRFWHNGDGTKFMHLFVHRPGWWIFYCGWIQVEYFAAKKVAE